MSGVFGLNLYKDNLSNMRSELVDLQISNSIFCSVIDTFRKKIIWKKVFGSGTLNKLSKIGESDISNISDQKFFNSVQRIVNEFQILSKI